MSRQYQQLVSELKATVTDLVLEAQAGDSEARSWLLTSFPGHDRLFFQLWNSPPSTPHRPRRTIIKQEY